jgi:hypothetical protein
MKGIGHLGDFGLDVRIILKMHLKIGLDSSG